METETDTETEPKTETEKDREKAAAATHDEEALRRPDLRVDPLKALRLGVELAVGGPGHGDDDGHDVRRGAGGEGPAHHHSDVRG